MNERALTPSTLPRDRQDHLPIPQADSSNLLVALVSAARDSQTDMAKMERIFAMHKEIMAIQNKANFQDALARAQEKLEPARVNRKNTHTGSMYATLAAVMVVVMPAITSEKLSLSFTSEPCPIDGWQRTIGILSGYGHEQRYPIDLPPDKAGSAGKVNKTDIQAEASSRTYAQRILTKMIFGLSEDSEDRDGNSARGGGGFDPNAPGMSEDHEETLKSMCEAISPTQLSKVMKSYKVTRVQDIPDSEYESIITRLNKGGVK